MATRKQPDNPEQREQTAQALEDRLDERLGDAMRGYQEVYQSTPPSLLDDKLVYWQMSRALGDFAKIGIAKTRENKEQGFKFRGVDELMNTAAPIFARHGILIFPTVENRTQTERLSRNGGTMFNVVLQVRFTFVSAVDGSQHSAVLAGEATDSGDKATNKAQAAAFKYCLLQAFCVPLEGEAEDADATTNEPTAMTVPPGYKDFVARVGMIAALGLTQLRKEWKEAKNGDVALWQHLVERDKENWPLIKGKAEDVEALLAKQAAEKIRNEGQ